MMLLPCLMAVAAFFLWRRLLRRQRAVETPKDLPEGLNVPDDYMTVSCPPIMKPSRHRCKFSAGSGVTVMGWPSKGGIYILGCTGVELDFLGIDRYHDTERLSEWDPDASTNEEAHCNRMRQLGAEWWPNEMEWAMSQIDPSTPPRPYIEVGWPAGGVWVLKTTDDDAMERGTARISIARDMEERCRVIEQLGGVFYANPKDCPHLDLP